MQRKVPATYSLFLVIAVAILFLSNNSNPPNGYTGTPPNGQTCASCHSGGSNSGNVAITGLPATIIPDQIYPLTVTITRTNATPQKAGFQMTALDGNNAFAGFFNSPSAGTTIQSSSGIFYFEHNPGQNFGAGNVLNFTVNWRAPATDSGPITLYAAANLVNNNGNTSGDFVTTTVASGTLDASGGAIIPNVSSTPVTCFGGSNGTATANPTGGGGGPYSYLWSTGSMQQSVNNLSTGTYFVTVMNGMGDMAVGMTTISSPPQLFVNITSSGNISCANPNGFATAQASGGVPGYTYAWSTGASGTSAVFSTPGTYFVTATDASQCPVVTSVTITANTTAPAAFAGPDRVISCGSPTATLNGAGSSTGAGISYLWTGPAIVSGGTTLSPVVNQTGTYTLTVTNQSNGCTATDQVGVTGSTTPPTASAGPDRVLTCTNLTAVLNGGGSSSGANITYGWTGPGIVSGGATNMPVVNMAGTYTLTVTNQTNGCVATDQVAVTSNTAPPTANAGTDLMITCALPSVTLNGAGSTSGANISYAWSGPGIVSGGTTPAPVVNAAGIYILTVTNQTNGCSASDQVVVENNTAPPTADAGTGQTLTCAITSVTLNGTGSSSGANIVYGWAGPGIVSGGTTTSPVVNVAGTYTLTVTNQTSGCSASSQVMVLSDTLPPMANAGPDLAITCGNTTVTLNGSSSGANMLYAWSGPGIVSGDTTATPVVNLGGIYTLTVANQSNGCVAMDQTSVVVNTALGLEVQTTTANCFGASTGTATAIASGGNGNYTYAWSTGATTSQITGLAAGTYSVTATNGNCTATSNATVSQPPVLVINVLTTAETAPGAADGTATAMATGGTADYTFVWSNGATTAALTGLAPGTYSVTASDSQGCTVSTSAEVNNSICNGFGIALTPADMVCQEDMSGSVAAVVTGGAEPFTFEWSNGGTESGISGLAAGVYSVSVTDANNCSLTASAAVALLPDLTPPVVVAQPLTVYLSVAGEVEITPEMADNGSLDNCGIVEWQLSKSQFLCDETGVQTVMLTAIDAAGNEAMAELLVTVLDTIAPDLVCPISVSTIGCNIVLDYQHPPVVELCGNDLVFIPVEVTADLPIGSILPFGETVITLEATDPSGNSTACSFSVNVSNIPIPAAELVDPLCSGSADGSIFLGPSGDAAGYSYQWDDPAGQTDSIAVGLSAGIYNVIISGNSNGCIDTFTYTLEAPTSVEITLDELVAELSTEMNGAISVTASGGQGAPYTYIWRFNGQVVSTEEDLTGLSMGEYILTVVDFNGCVALDTFVVDRLTNALNPVSDYSLLLYPNPAEDLLYLQLAGEQAANLEVALLDLDGRLLHQPVQAFSARHTFSVNVGDYVPGVYLARIIIGEKVLWRKVVVE